VRSWRARAHPAALAQPRVGQESGLSRWLEVLHKHRPAASMGKHPHPTLHMSCNNGLIGCSKLGAPSSFHPGGCAS
jgi:hypothetical protein